MTGEWKIIRLINMTDLDRNMRTLIVCLVIALVGLVPLKFVEIQNQGLERMSQSQVLGATTVVKLEPEKEEMLILPNAELLPETLK